ncbi:MAG: Dipeptide transport system permease protein DppC [uncultured Thermomicrobiales bacterium]|uniref:Dipeptide transport system permease protein DppC n=1 Tax=uncultured Thermomicrobiales bacterium TaxID=1645740 RepID=A0A6J4V9C2_9BACT|nr:MAG: Dipeptide transport system permease protein DppC [uncultured Thermomicrobiales bacterium]
MTIERAGRRRKLSAVRRAASQNRAGSLAALVLMVLATVAILAPWIAPQDAATMSPLNRLRGPGEGGLLGGDLFGRDVLSRVLYGARISLLVGISSVIVSAVIGTALGLMAGFLGGWAEYVTMRVMDVLFAFPAVLLAILVVAVFEPGFVSIIVAISVVYMPIFARVVRGSTLTLKHVEYVQAAVTSGASTSRVILRHLLPNVTAPILVQLTLSLSGAIILEAALSFLGLGAVPPTPSLGSMLSENRVYMELAPWTIIYPGVTLALLVFGINLVGDAVRDLIDPRLRTQG